LGPIPLQVGQDSTGNAQFDWIWLPLVCSKTDRERAASVLSSVAISVGPVVQSLRNEDSVLVEAKLPSTSLLSLRPFARGGVPLSAEEELRAGALEILACTGETKAVRGISSSWLPIRDSVRLKLQNMQRTPNVQLSAAWVLRLMMASQPAICADLGLDVAKVDTLSRCAPGPFAPGICNLFEGLQLK
jgi:hypothetical protein